MIAAVPMALVVIQPDLGTTMVFGAIWLAIAWGAGLRPLHLVALVLLAAPVLFVAWTSDALLDGYQKIRLLTFYYLLTDPTKVDFNDGYNVIQAGGGRAALERFDDSIQEGSRENIDLAVIDFVLAEPADGLDVFRKMAEVRPRQKAVLASGFADLARLTEAKRTGVGRIIPKPYTQESLTRAVREVLDS